jgi:fructose-1,6-bisphosphatase II / sedoheptulose-1,7-bisphosphatase
MLFNGERIGNGNPPAVDIAVDPLEGTTLTSLGRPNAISVIAMTERGQMNCPREIVYMNKIAVGPQAAGSIDITASPSQNLRWIAKAKRATIPDLTVVILDRPRHEELIRRVREAGARIMLISDGDVSGVISTARPDSGVDIYMGSGGAPEGVLAAAALRCIGGQMQGRLLFRNDDEKGRARRWGITDLNRKYGLNDLAKGDVMFAATGVTDGAMLRGVRRGPHTATTHSMVMRSKSGTVRVVEAQHNWKIKASL